MPEGSESSVYFYFVEKLFKGFFSYHTHSHTCCVRIQIGLGQYKCKSLTKKQSNLGCKQTPDASLLWSAENSQTQRVLGTDWQSRQETHAFPRKLSCENEIHLWFTGWSWGEVVKYSFTFRLWKVAVTQRSALSVELVWRFGKDRRKQKHINFRVF